MKTIQPVSNIAVKANIWCNPNMTEVVQSSEFLQPILPGDLLVHLIGTTDVRFIDRDLTRRQLIEYKQSRFFQNHGQEGIAYGNPPTSHRNA